LFWEPEKCSATLSCCVRFASIDGMELTRFAS
jgi:hypothetical protein